MKHYIKQSDLTIVSRNENDEVVFVTVSEGMGFYWPTQIELDGNTYAFKRNEPKPDGMNDDVGYARYELKKKKKEKKELYRLQLQRRLTTDPQELIDECNTIRDGLARWGIKVLGYDPGVSVFNAEHPNATAEIPLWLLKKMLAATPSVSEEWMQRLEELIDEHGRYRWETGCAETSFDKLEARRADKAAVEARESIMSHIQRHMGDPTMKK